MSLLQWLRFGRRRTSASDTPDAGLRIQPDYVPLFPLERPADPQAAAPSEAAVLQTTSPGTFWRVQSANGGEVFATSDGRLVHRSSPRPNDGAAVLLFLPRRDGETAFLISDAPAPLRVHSDDLLAEALSFVVVPGSDGLVSLRHPLKPRFVSAAWIEPGREVELICDRSEAKGWEMLRIEQVQPGPLVSRLSDIVVELAGFYATEIDARRLGQWLRTRQAHVRSAIGGAVLRAMPIDVVRELAHDMLGDPQLRDAVLATLSADIWTRDVLPALAAWCDRRDQVRTLVIDRTLDVLATSFVQHQGCMSAGNLLASLARTRVDPRRTLAMVATARNEGIYFLEWIAHHRALGVEHFFIYSNDNNDDSDVLLEALADAGVITWIPNHFDPKVDGQMKAYAHSLSCLPQSLDYRWTMIADLDEFVVVDTTRNRDLRALVEAREAQGANAVSLTWLMYTIGGQIDRRRDPLIDRNRHVVGYENTEVKTLFRTRDFAYSWPHDPTPVLGTRVVHHNASGNLHHWPGRTTPPSNGPPHYKDAWLAHYYFKSMEEWIWKVSRNRGGYELNPELKVDFDKIAGQAADVSRSTELRDDRAAAHLPGLKAELAGLLGVPGVADAQERVDARFETLVADLRRRAVDGFIERARTATDQAERHRAQVALEVLAGGDRNTF